MALIHVGHMRYLTAGIAPLIGSRVLQKLKQSQGPQPGSGSTTS